MKVMDRLLIAVEFDSTLEPLVAQAMHLAKTFDAEIVPVHALEHLGEKQEAGERLQTLVARLERGGCRVHNPILQHGRPFSIILTTANALDVNAILLGARSKGLAERLFSGITANKVMHRAVMPVWVVREGTPEISRILCSMDYSSAAEQALRTAIHLCRNLDAELQVLHVVSDGPGSADRQQDQLSSEMEKLAAHLRHFDLADLTFTKSLKHGKVHETILQVAGDSQADLVVMGAFGEGSILDQFLGNNADKLLRSAPCSVLTVKHQDIFKIMHESFSSPDEKEAAAERWAKASVRELAEYIEDHYERGRELLEKGFLEDAIVEFRLCLDRDNLFSGAYDGIATAYERQGNERKARHYRELAREHRSLIWYQKVQTGIRSQHTLFTEGSQGSEP